MRSGFDFLADFGNVGYEIAPCLYAVVSVAVEGEKGIGVSGVAGEARYIFILVHLLLHLFSND